MSKQQQTTSKSFKKDEVKIEEKLTIMANTEEMTNWVEDLYDISKVTPEMIRNMWESFSYQGFSREETLKQLYVLVKDKKIVYELIVLGALRGPQAGSKIKLSNGLTPIEMRISASGQKGKKTLSMNKIVSSTADIAAWFLKNMNAPKRISSELPGWLQFPGAGSIKLPPNLRILHIEFSKKFSTLIGGAFNENIYSAMESNAYLDQRLKLFE
jgi:hypothetical protein